MVLGLCLKRNEARYASEDAVDWEWKPGEPLPFTLNQQNLLQGIKRDFFFLFRNMLQINPKWSLVKSNNVTYIVSIPHCVAIKTKCMWRQTNVTVNFWNFVGRNQNGGTIESWWRRSVGCTGLHPVKRWSKEPPWGCQRYCPSKRRKGILNFWLLFTFYQLTTIGSSIFWLSFDMADQHNDVKNREMVFKNILQIKIWIKHRMYF